MSSDKISPIFHPGEQAMHARLGIQEKMHELGPRVIRDHMPAPHRQLFEKLPMLIIGAVDEQNQPWASLLTGPPGFISSPNETSLVISAKTQSYDPLANAIQAKKDIALLGIEFETRRRNRMNASIKTVSKNQFTVQVKQSFGNCPKYIQRRQHHWQEDFVSNPQYQNLEQFDQRAQEIIESADCFFITSLFMDEHPLANRGVDVSHRGGKPGFVKVKDSRSLTFPDYPGNRFFNTLGNLELNPASGLLFIEYKSGCLLYLSGQTETVWDDEEIQQFQGAERLLRFTLKSGRLVSQALPLKWDFVDYSPALNNL